MNQVNPDFSPAHDSLVLKLNHLEDAISEASMLSSPIQRKLRVHLDAALELAKLVRAEVVK